jgi:hypothetical protein
MYYGRKWEVLSGVCNMLLAAFVVVIPLQQDAYWWRIIVGLLAFAAIFALHRALKSERIPRRCSLPRLRTRCHPGRWPRSLQWLGFR